MNWSVYFWAIMIYSRGWQKLAHRLTWPTACFVNKFLLECNHAHSFTYYLCLLLCYGSRTEESWQRLYDPQKVKYVLFVPFRESICWLLIYRIKSNNPIPSSWADCLSLQPHLDSFLPYYDDSNYTIYSSRKEPHAFLFIISLLSHTTFSAPNALLNQPSLLN